jgi:uncharacterized protein YjbJ (UPF0337 family)
MNEDMIEGVARNGLGALEQATGEVVKDPKLQLKGVKDKVVGQAQEAFGKVRETTTERLDDVGEFVKERPYAALAIAALVGVVVGHALSANRSETVYLRDPRG